MELPPEIQAMDQEDTVCSVCGVSYLIFREIKALEKRIRSLEADMREKDETVKSATTALESALKCKSDTDEIIAGVNAKCEQKIANLNDEHQAALRVAKAEGTADARSLLQTAEATAKAAKKLREDMRASVQGLMTMARQLKQEHSRMRDSVTSELGVWSREAGETTAAVMSSVQTSQQSLVQSGLRADEVARQLQISSNLIDELKQSHQDQLHKQTEQANYKMLEQTALINSSTKRAEQAEAEGTEAGLALTFAQSALAEKEKLAEEERKAAAAQLKAVEKVLKQQIQMTEQAESALANLKEAYSDGAEQLGSMSQQTQGLQSQLAQAAEEKQQLKSELEQALDQADAQLKASSQEKHKLTALLTQLEAKVATAQAGRETSNLKLTEHIERLKVQLAGTQTQLTQAQAQQEKQLQLQQNLKADLLMQEKVSCENLSNKSALEQEMRAQTAEMDQLRARLATAEQLAQSSEAASTAQADSVAELQNELRAAKQTTQAAEEAVHMAQESQQAAEEAQRLAEQARKEAETKAASDPGEGAWQAKLGEFEGVVSRLAEAVRIKDMMVQTLQGTVQRECEERQNLTQKVASLEEQLKQVPQQVPQAHQQRRNSRSGGSDKKEKTVSNGSSKHNSRLHPGVKLPNITTPRSEHR